MTLEMVSFLPLDISSPDRIPWIRKRNNLRHVALECHLLLSLPWSPITDEFFLRLRFACELELKKKMNTNKK